MEASDNCAWYEHSKYAGPICSKYGTNYSKVEVIKQRSKADSEIISATARDVLDNGFTMEVVDSATAIEDPALEENLPSRTACYADLRLRGSA